jgi:HEAT repeat protein
MNKYLIVAFMAITSVIGIGIIIYIAFSYYEKAPAKTIVQDPPKTTAPNPPPASISPKVKTITQTPQPTIDQQPKPITAESKNPVDLILSKITEWKKKYPDLFREHPELAAMLENSQCLKSMKLLLTDKSWPEAMGLIVDLVEEWASAGGIRSSDFTLDDFKDILGLWKEKGTPLIRETVKYICPPYDYREGPVMILGYLSLLSASKEETTLKIIKIFSDATDPFFKRNAMRIFGNLKEKEPMEIMTKLLSDGYFKSEDPDKETTPELIRLLSDSDAQVRGGTIRILELLRAKEAKEEAIKLIIDPNDHVSFAAYKFIKIFPANEVVPELIKLLSDSASRKEKVAVSVSLSDLKESASEIAKLLSAPDTQTRVGALFALNIQTLGGHKLDIKEAIPAIIKFLSDADAENRIEAIYIIGASTAKETIPDIEKLLTDPNENVRKAAQETLKKLKGE